MSSAKPYLDELEGCVRRIVLGDLRFVEKGLYPDHWDDRETRSDLLWNILDEEKPHLKFKNKFMVIQNWADSMSEECGEVINLFIDGVQESAYDEFLFAIFYTKASDLIWKTYNGNAASSPYDCC